MAGTAIAWEPLSDRFGAKADIDLAQPMGADLQAAWRELLRDRGLVVVEGRPLSADQQERVTGYSGKLALGSSPDGSYTNVNFISTDPAKGGLGTGELAYHSDLSFTRYPYETICLYALKVTDGASSTRFVSGASGYASLPASLKARIEGLEVMNVISSVRIARNQFTDAAPDLPCFIHPLVRRPPDGAPYLFASEAQTDHVMGLSPAESDEILDEVFAHLYAPGNCVEHVWRADDLVIWDNQALQHARGRVDAVGERTLRKFQTGAMGLHEQTPEFMAKIRASYR